MAEETIRIGHAFNAIMKSEMIQEAKDTPLIAHLNYPLCREDEILTDAQ